MSGRRYKAKDQPIRHGGERLGGPLFAGRDLIDIRNQFTVAEATQAAVVLPIEKPKAKPSREKKPKDPDIERAQVVADVAVDAVRILARAWPEFTYPMVRATVLHSIYLEFATALGMRVPRLELVLDPYNGAGLDAFLARVRSLPFADLTPEHFGAAHEHLTGYALVDCKIERSDGRRAAGVHFTPRSLTEPIVRRTLEPLLRIVPPERTLELRVCDPAVGAGAFLLELVRQLGARVHDAGLASSLDEAKRLVAIHCAYGVDICRFGVAATKLALALECRADRMPDDWLDDNVKCGDALVGLMNDQIKRFHWSPDGKDAKGRDLPVIPWIAAVVDKAMDQGVERRRARIASLSDLARRAA